jgi:2-polyprenyl-6-hydroxyphenyl methylase/3-demethylubiquinone-9 3-methyltransferase
MERNVMTIPENFEQYIELFKPHGGTDVPYAQHHFQRYLQNKARLLSHWDRTRGNKLLDIGAHWLHQAILYAIDGFEVTALDFPITFEMENVRSLANAHAIRLLPNTDLETAAALKAVPDNSFDLVLFSEILEHITFNPVAMWKEVYRVMKPGARIVVTTPNYYAWRGRTWKWERFFQRFGGGLEVLNILNHHTYAHHWKEYSLRELIYYFCVLSPDFNCLNPSHVEEYEPGYHEVPAGKFVRWLERRVPILRPDVYLEVEIARKDKGIVVEPHW